MLKICIIKKIKIKNLISMLNFENIKQFKFKKFKKLAFIDIIMNPILVSPLWLYLYVGSCKKGCPFFVALGFVFVFFGSTI